MALTGCHIAAIYVGLLGRNGVVQALIRPPVWSENPAENVATTNIAPTDSKDDGRPCFEISPAVDVYVSIGIAPDATVSPRILIRGGDTRQIGCSPGHKAAWKAA